MRMYWLAHKWEGNSKKRGDIYIYRERAYSLYQTAENNTTM